MEPGILIIVGTANQYRSSAKWLWKGQESLYGNGGAPTNPNHPQKADISSQGGESGLRSQTPRADAGWQISTVSYAFDGACYDVLWSVAAGRRPAKGCWPAEGANGHAKRPERIFEGGFARGLGTIGSAAELELYSASVAARRISEEGFGSRRGARWTG